MFTGVKNDSENNIILSWHYAYTTKTYITTYITPINFNNLLI